MLTNEPISNFIAIVFQYVIYVFVFIIGFHYWIVLFKFGYDPTNVKYMNTDILDQAYNSATKIRAAEAGEQQSSN